MKKIIVVGYPKSGNTWLSRLTASLIDCPVEGFLYSNHEEIATEGMNRESDFRLFKSHHQLSEITQRDINNAKIIYIIRDPRDISISGRHFFSFVKTKFSNTHNDNCGLFFKIMNSLKNKIKGAYLKVMNKFISKKEMNKAVLYGNRKANVWCRVSWKEHIIPYLNNSEILKVKYESILSDPMTHSKRILNFLGVKRDDEEILKCINDQSFSNKKKQFLESRQIAKAKFLRNGKKEQWKTSFTKKENRIFVNLLEKELTDLGYDIEI